jgi:hypothetical protein
MLTKAQAHFDLGTSRKQDVQSGSKALQLRNVGPLGPSIAVASGELADIKNRLGFLDAFLLQREIGREAKRAIGEAYVLLIEAQRQALVSRITHGLDEEKKRLFVESIHASNAIDQEIATLSGDFTHTMFEGALTGSVAAARAELETLQKIEALRREGEITEARHEQLRSAASEACDHVTNIVKSNVAKIVKSHLEKLEGTLELFKERALREGL